MMRHVFIFVVAAGAGALLALLLRSALHRPYVGDAPDTHAHAAESP